MSVLVDVAEAVKTAMTTTIGGTALVPVRAWQVVEELEQTPALVVTIVPVTRPAVDALSRGETNYTAVVDVVVQKKLADVTNAIIDPLVDIVDAIVAFWRSPANRNLASPTGWTLEGPEFPDGSVLLSDHLTKYRQFTSVLRLTFRTIS